jgi:hypothetical protein
MIQKQAKRLERKKTLQHGKNLVIIKQIPMPEQQRDANYICHQFPLLLARPAQPIKFKE